ncbi:TadE/TadG family type IV pilus assembly protein [Caulobacter endophyticus]|uniref:TadE/TadG family type IV pilus assembly protein n=1 Tax=Caulobacter endophyticus TaxID=2172652 RepID=UPI002410A91C|nr:TadE family protein [Caulobacter endophyticus]MDG2529068.1 pilus assembly protein [Caulobacter endophyticus]
MTRLRTTASRLVRDESAATATEFGLVCFAFIVMLLAVIDMGRLGWTINTAKTATREGARLAVVSPMVSTYMAGYDGTATYGGGGTVPDMAFSCTGSNTTCTQTQGSGGSPGFDNTTFTAVLNKMQAYQPDITAADVTITYRHVGIGKVGNPYAPDMEPLVSVSVANLTFQSVALQIFGVAPFNLPTMTSTLSGESLS